MTDTETVKEAIKQLRTNGWDIWTQEGIDRFTDSIDQFFQANPTLPVTLQNIYRAFEERKSEFAWLSAAAVKWYETAQQNPELANQVANYIASTTGHPGSLVKDGDSLFENLLLIFNELQSRRESLNPQTIAAAKNRIDNRPGKLRRVSQPRRTEPVSRAAKEDDGTPFLGNLVKNPDGSFRSKTFTEQARERETAERAKQSQSQTQTLDPSEASWKGLADGLLNDGHHGQQARVRAVYDHEVNQGSSWRKVFEACKREANAHSRTIRGANGFMDDFKDSIRRQ